MIEHASGASHVREIYRIWASFLCSRSDWLRSAKCGWNFWTAFLPGWACMWSKDFFTWGMLFSTPLSQIGLPFHINICIKYWLLMNVYWGHIALKLYEKKWEYLEMSRWRNKPGEANTKFITHYSGEYQELCLWGDTYWLKALSEFVNQPKAQDQCFSVAFPKQLNWSWWACSLSRMTRGCWSSRASTLRAPLLRSKSPSLGQGPETNLYILKGSILEPIGNMVMFCPGAFWGGSVWKLSLGAPGKPIFF